MKALFPVIPENGEYSQQPHTPRWWWQWACIFVGLGLWGQLFASPLIHELMWEDTRLWAVLLYLGPLLVLAAGAYTRSAIILLAFYLLSLLPGYLVTLEPDRIELQNALDAILIGGSWLAYICLACMATLHTTGVSISQSPLSEPLNRADAMRERATIWFVISRSIIVLLWLMTISYAVFFDASIAAYFHEFYASSYREGIVFAAIAMLFVWIVIVYNFILLPALNYEYEQQQLGRLLARKNLHAEILRRVAVWLTVGFFISLIYWYYIHG